MDDDGREVPRGEPGEIWTAGPMIAREYWNDPKATAARHHRRLLAYRRHRAPRRRGYLHVSDRMKDMLNRGGLKIYSVEVENVLQQYPGVVEAAVVGKPCPVLGERVHAFVYAGGKHASTKRSSRRFARSVSPTTRYPRATRSRRSRYPATRTGRSSSVRCASSSLRRWRRPALQVGGNVGYCAAGCRAA